MKPTVKKLLLLCCVLALCLTGCGGKASTVRGVQLTEREQAIAALADGAVAGLEFAFQEDIQGFVLQREIWKYGNLMEPAVVAYGDTDSLQALYICEKQENNADNIRQIIWEGVLAEKETVQRIPLAQISFPECKDNATFAQVTHIWGREEQEAMTLQAGDSYILAVKCVDLNDDGMTGVRCGSYEEAQALLQEHDDCVILLRMDTFATAQEAEAEAEAREQENRAKIIARLQ